MADKAQSKTAKAPPKMQRKAKLTKAQMAMYATSGVDRPLLPQHDLFALCIGMHGMTQRQAYIEAYPDSCASNTTKDREAHRLAQNPNIVTRIDYYRRQQIALQADNAIADARETSAFLTDVMRGEPQPQSVIESDEDGTQAIKDIYVRPEMQHRLGAAKELVKIHGMVVDKHEHNHTGNIGIVAAMREMTAAELRDLVARSKQAQREYADE